MKTHLTIFQNGYSGTFSCVLGKDNYLTTVLAGGTKDQARLVLHSCEQMNSVIKGTLSVTGMSLLK